MGHPFQLLASRQGPRRRVLRVRTALFWPIQVSILLVHTRTLKYEEGDPETVAYDLKVFFNYTVRQLEQLEKLIENMTHGLTKERILKVRKIARRLWEETLDLDGYDLVPKLKQLRIPTLVIHGDYDFVPLACAQKIASAIPGARFVLLKDTGHFSYIERANEVRKEISNFLGVE